MTDRRITPSTGRTAHVSLRGLVAAERFVEGRAAAVAVPLADLCASPGGARDRQLLLGAAVTVIEDAAGHAFVQAAADGYCGWVAAGALGPAIVPTHRLAAASSHLYPAPDLKARELCAIPHGARLRIVAEHGRFAETDAGAFVPARHLRPVAELDADPVAVAALYLGAPYLWGGNSRWGIDCSGLVQAALSACGVACPGDSDLQMRAFAETVLPHDIRRGDLMFWKGHVALAIGPEEVLHANAHAMAVTRERLVEVQGRIAEAGEGGLLGVRRPG
jgi:cell wall-associated NlpC family hydrolase